MSASTAPKDLGRKAITMFIPYQLYFVRIFSEVLIPSLQLFNLHTELLPAKKQEVSTHVSIPIYQLPSLQAQTDQTTLRRLDLKQVSWLHSPQTAPILT